MYGFELIKERRIEEIDTIARYFIHKKTGARLLSLSNKDENKVFGISFRTPPSNSTGVPHILEHSVLCGSRKYPVKEPFVELLKGSMSTFLNAFTYPDKTCYPVASQNVKDFYNLIDVYLDAVFYPRLTRYTFMQEGWHYELESIDSPLSINGIVYNEMKGAYSSPDIMLDEYSLRSLFPDTIYRFDAGGDPKEIPNLSYEDFLNFHRKFYHPSNSFIWFYGDDDPEERLRFISRYLDDFERQEIDSKIPPQPQLNKQRYITFPFMAEKEETKGMITLNWLFPDIHDQKMKLSFMILEHILIGMPGSPLRKALIESGLGEDLAGVGLEKEIRHLFFSTGLKGVHVENMKKVEALIFDTLSRLVKEGIDPDTVDAAINTIEFRLRENNTGRFPRGLSLMLRALSFWIYDKDPIAAISFEKELNEIKEEVRKDKSYFESMIKKYFLENLHRTVVMLKPDPEMKKREEEEERRRLDEIKKRMSIDELKKIIEDVKELKRLQQMPDSPSALAKIPVLDLKDIDRENKRIPIDVLEREDAKILFHDIFTNGIFYIDVGFNLNGLEKDLIPYIPIIGRAIIEIGTEKEDYVKISQRIGQHTGGIERSILIDQIRESKDFCFWLFLRGKALVSKIPELLDILKDLLLIPDLNNKERFLQIVLEEKARYEKNLIPSGHEILKTRICSHLSRSGWLREMTEGISYLFFLRKLVGLIKESWEKVLSDIKKIHNWLSNRSDMILNITCPEKDFLNYENHINSFILAIPKKQKEKAIWEEDRIPEKEALLIKAKVNFVGKGESIYRLGHRFHGSQLVITRYLRNTLLWERVRVQGGAYGAYCIFDRLTGEITFLSYRDPNIGKTLENFDESASFLRKIDLDKRELTKGIIRTIADIDAPLLPDTKGFRSLRYYLTNDTEEERQRMREEVLGTEIKHFREFADVLEDVKEKGIVKVMCPEERLPELREKVGDVHTMFVT